MTPRERTTYAALLAVLLTSSAIAPVFQGGSWFLRPAGAAATVALLGVAGRRLHVPALLQPLLGLAGLVSYAVLVFAGSTLKVVVPTGETVTRVRTLLETAGDAISTTVAPVPADDGFVLLTVLAVGAVMVLVDLLAVSAGRAVLASVPLLLLLVIPAAIVAEATPWWCFTLAVAGWLLLLLVEGGERRSRWGAPLRAVHQHRPVAGQGGAGTRIGLTAVGVAMIVPLLLPAVGEGLVQGGGGAGDDSRTVTTYNPITRLRGQLTLPEPVDVLRYTTDDGDPDYLRMTTLSIYDGAGWRQDTLNGSLRDDGVNRRLAAPIGRTSATTTRTVTARITISTLNAFWLPVPATPVSVDVDGPWLWDRVSESVFATRTDTRRLAPYTVESARATPTAGDLEGAGVSLPSEIAPYAKPIDATDKVRRTTAQVTAGATTAYGKAVAIQDWFRDPANNFVYDEQTRDGSSPDALQDFLEQRRGYCEQYSSAMAAMLRLAGVPARVAVGFTPGRLQADGSYLVTTDQAHAWPEAWFDGVGWIRFEPTPSTGFTPPGYSRLPAAQQPTAPLAAASAGPSAEPSASTPANESKEERDARLEAEREAAGLGAAVGDGGGGPPVLPLALGGGLLILLVLPAVTHQLRRRARSRRMDPARAWDQVCDDALDVGLPIDPARSLRQARDVLIRQATLTGLPRAALQRLAAAVERDRYAPPGAIAAADPATLAADARIVRGGLHANLTPGQRRRIRLLPPSTLRWSGGAVSGQLERMALWRQGLRGRLTGRRRGHAA